MNAGTTYAVVTFLAGVLCLLGWLFATTDLPRSTGILRKSVWLMVLPMLLTPASWFTFPLSMWVLVAFEEGVKAFASTREADPSRKFWLVSLFGVWELTLDKPFWGLVIGQSAGSFDRTSLIGLVLTTIIPVAMHTVTAAIYAFWFEGRLWAAFIASWVIHTAFNESVANFGFSPAVQLAHAACLALLLAGLIARRRRTPITDRR